MQNGNNNITNQIPKLTSIIGKLEQQQIMQHHQGIVSPVQTFKKVQGLSKQQQNFINMLLVEKQSTDYRSKNSKSVQQSQVLSHGQTSEQKTISQAKELTLNLKRQGKQLSKRELKMLTEAQQQKLDYLTSQLASRTTDEKNGNQIDTSPRQNQRVTELGSKNIFDYQYNQKTFFQNDALSQVNNINIKKTSQPKFYNHLENGGYQLSLNSHHVGSNLYQVSKVSEPQDPNKQRNRSSTLNLQHPKLTYSQDGGVSVLKPNVKQLPKLKATLHHNTSKNSIIVDSEAQRIHQRIKFSNQVSANESIKAINRVVQKIQDGGLYRPDRGLTNQNYLNKNVVIKGSNQEYQQQMQKNQLISGETNVSKFHKPQVQKNEKQTLYEFINRSQALQASNNSKSKKSTMFDNQKQHQLDIVNNNLNNLSLQGQTIRQVNFNNQDFYLNSSSESQQNMFPIAAPNTFRIHANNNQKNHSRQTSIQQKLNVVRINNNNYKNGSFTSKHLNRKVGLDLQNNYQINPTSESQIINNDTLRHLPSQDSIDGSSPDRTYDRDYSYKDQRSQQIQSHRSTKFNIFETQLPTIDKQFNDGSYQDSQQMENNPMESPMDIQDQRQPITSNEKIKQLHTFIKMIDYEKLHNDSRYSSVLKRQMSNTKDQQQNSPSFQMQLQNQFQQLAQGQIDRNMYQNFKKISLKQRIAAYEPDQVHVISERTSQDLSVQGNNLANSIQQATNSMNLKKQQVIQNPQYQVFQTLFVMDCQTLGLLENRRIFNDTFQGSTFDRGRINRNPPELSESQVVDFIIEKLQKYSTSQFVENIHQFKPPKLSDEAKTIINTIRAQQQISIPHEISMIDTLIIEIDYNDFKYNLLFQLYKYFGQDVIDNLKMDQSNTQRQLQDFKFQSINEFVTKVKRYHDESAKFANKILFDNINNHDRDEDFKKEKKKRGAINFELPNIENQHFLQTQRSGFILSKDRMEIKRSSRETDQRRSSMESMHRSNSKRGLSISSQNFQVNGKNQSPKKLLQNEQCESKKIYIKQACNLMSQKHDMTLRKMFRKDRFNMQVFTKNSLMHECLILKDQKQKVQNADYFMEMAGAENHQRGKTISDLSFINELSSFIYTQDSSLLRYAVFCSEAGIIQNPYHLLKLFFKNVFVMVKNFRDKEYEKNEEMSRLVKLDQELKNSCNKMSMNLTSSANKKKASQLQIDTGAEPSTQQSPTKEPAISADDPLSKPTTITIFHKPYSHLSQCKINRALANYNEFISLTLKNRQLLTLNVNNTEIKQKIEFKKSDMDKIYRLASIIGIPMPKKPQHAMYNQNLPSIMEHFKVPKNVQNIKELLVKYISRAINDGNGLTKNVQEYLLYGKNVEQEMAKKEKVLTYKDLEQEKKEDKQEKNQKQHQPFVNYTYQVGLGNNHHLIKQLMKERWWTTKVKAGMNEEVQILWTQWRKLKVYDNLTKSEKFNGNYSKVLEMLDLESFDLISDLQKQLKDVAGIRQLQKQLQTASQENATPQQKEKQKSVEVQLLKDLVRQMKFSIQKVYNKLECNHHLNNKKALFFNMKNYYNFCCEGDVFETLPLTFHVKKGLEDGKFIEFKTFFDQEQEKIDSATQKNLRNVWIIKPGENSNRGTGIVVESKYDRIQELVQNGCTNGRTVILQKYISNPLLYKYRKFDVRCFSLVTSINGHIKAYFYKIGYIRTASKEYTLAQNQLHNKFIHLVNDAVQKYSDDYGKYETANKLSYAEFQKYLTTQFPDKNINFERDIMSQVQKVVTDTIRATFHLLDPQKRLNSYEIFGYDFMFDTSFRPQLIEVNSNPSLECSSSMLTKLFHDMIENTFKIAIDPLFPPPAGFLSKKSSGHSNTCSYNNFELIFDERIDGPELLEKLNKIDQKQLEELKEIEGSLMNDDEAEEIFDGDQQSPTKDRPKMDEDVDQLAKDEKDEMTNEDE